MEKNLYSLCVLIDMVKEDFGISMFVVLCSAVQMIKYLDECYDDTYGCNNMHVRFSLSLSTETITTHLRQSSPSAAKPLGENRCEQTLLGF